MTKIKDLTGETFGRLTVVKMSQVRGKWDCTCECGNETTVITGYLTRGHTDSCGYCGENPRKLCKYCRTSNNVTYSNIHKMPLCDVHRSQMNRCGKILERSRFDENEIVILGDHAEVVLYNQRSEECGRAIIDTKNIDMIKKYKWCLSSGYAITMVENKTLSMHRLITDYYGTNDIDHINNNPLDNRLDNLRECNRSQNSANQKVRSNNTSGYKGVSWNNRKKRWEATICVNGKRMVIGRSVDKDKAIQLRKEAEIKYQGEFRYKGVI